jgi:ribosomal protein S18 acetylase RimI-like enzyme
MSSAPPTTTTAPRTWARLDGQFFISTDPSLLSVKAVNEAFGQDWLYWGKPFPEKVMHDMLHGSMSFGVYKIIQPQPAGEPFTPSSETTEQIGLARMVTDGTTFGYLSDVYVLPEYQGHGLGRWLMSCISEVFSKENMPYLRRIMLLTGDKRMQDWYTKVFGMEVIAHEYRPDIGQDLVFMCARPNAKS